ncbi:CcmD family protein [Humidesulfovibrio sp.]|jgi:CcmD family protein
MEMNGYVLAANAAVWLFLAAYAASLALRGRSMANRLKQLEMLRDGND